MTLVNTLEQDGTVNINERASMADHGRLINKSFLNGYLEKMTRDEKTNMVQKPIKISPSKIGVSSPLRSIGKFQPRAEVSQLSLGRKNSYSLRRVKESVENLILNRSQDFQEELDSVLALARKQEITI